MNVMMILLDIFILIGLIYLISNMRTFNKNFRLNMLIESRKWIKHAERDINIKYGKKDILIVLKSIDYKKRNITVAIGYYLSDTLFLEYSFREIAQGKVYISLMEKASEYVEKILKKEKEDNKNG